MVHKKYGGGLLVIGVLLQEASSQFPLPNNTFLDHIWGGRHMDEIANAYVHEDEHDVVNPYVSFTPGSKRQFVYEGEHENFSFYALFLTFRFFFFFSSLEGSLTTPPCSEEVQWLVYNKPITISADDMRIIRETPLLWAHDHHGE